MTTRVTDMPYLWQPYLWEFKASMWCVSWTFSSWLNCVSASVYRDIVPIPAGRNGDVAADRISGISRPENKQSQSK